MARRILLGALVLLLLLLLSFALPVRLWRTGELPASPLPLRRPAPLASLPVRLWIDTDAACGRGRSTDPDDCFAILLLARSSTVDVVGISTVHGNAPLSETDSVTRALVAQLAPDRRPAVYRGAAGPVGEISRDAIPAPVALRRALAGGPLTILALGPLTNVALALEDGPAVRTNLRRLVAVMGRRPGHLFHPAEGGGGGILFGHGPVFTDFNYAQDREAAVRVLRFGGPLTLVPYAAARQLSLRGTDLDTIARSSDAGAWVVTRSRKWLDYWKDDVGRDGFYPFDLVGAAYVVRPELFSCARAAAWIGPDRRMWGWFRRPEGMLVDVAVDSVERPRASGRVIYCPDVEPGLHRWLVEALTSAQPNAGGPGALSPSG